MANNFCSLFFTIPEMYLYNSSSHELGRAAATHRMNLRLEDLLLLVLEILFKEPEIEYGTDQEFFERV